MTQLLHLIVFQATSATVVILALTHASAKDVYITVELLDETGKVIASERKYIGNNKTTCKVLFEFETEVEFVQIRICNFENVKERVGIASIEVSVA